MLRALKIIGRSNSSRFNKSFLPSGENGPVRLEDVTRETAPQWTPLVLLSLSVFLSLLDVGKLRIGEKNK
jgi:hypothetical protein